MTTSLHYRADIDGLRAIAVLAVIVFHINADWLPSGYLGVDIFFVISGYLITNIISNDLKNNQFSFIEFYKRRTKRILPVFLFILLIGSLVSAWLMIPVDFASYLRSVNASLFFASNLFFSKNNIGYFATSSVDKPLLHIWSLSLEEQFYFVFPFILWLAFRYLKSPWKMQMVVVGLCLVSIASGLLDYGSYQKYYLPQIRAYELLIGAWFALYQQTQPSLPLSQSLQDRIMGITASILLITLYLKPEWWFKRYYTQNLTICFFTGLLLIYGHYRQTYVQRFLSFKPLVMIGLLSYSLYLWHWVILALLRYVYITDILAYDVVVLAVILMLVLSYFSYQYVEQPFRKMTLSTQKWLVLGVVYVITAVAFHYGSKQYYHSVQQEIEVLKLHYPNKICHNDSLKNDCIRGDRSQKPHIIAMGDSHTGHHNPFYDRVGKHEHWSAYVHSSGGCSILLQSADIQPLFDRTKCLDVRKKFTQLIENPQFTTILLSQRWDSYLKNKVNYLEDLDKTLFLLNQKNKKVYLLEDNPVTPYVDRYIGHRELYLAKIGLHITRNISPEEQKHMDKVALANAQIKKLAEKYPNVHWVDMHFHQFIPKDFLINGLPIYTDDDHFNVYGSEQLAKQFIEAGYVLIK